VQPSRRVCQALGPVCRQAQRRRWRDKDAGGWGSSSSSHASSSRQKFSKALYVPTLCSKTTSELTFEKFIQQQRQEAISKVFYVVTLCTKRTRALTSQNLWQHQTPAPELHQRQPAPHTYRTPSATPGTSAHTAAAPPRDASRRGGAPPPPPTPPS
jgi:hypothetical protein